MRYGQATSEALLETKEDYGIGAKDLRKLSRFFPLSGKFSLACFFLTKYLNVFSSIRVLRLRMKAGISRTVNMASIIGCSRLMTPKWLNYLFPLNHYEGDVRKSSPKSNSSVEKPPTILE